MVKKQQLPMVEQYRQRCQEPRPGQAYIDEIKLVTGAKESTVRQWVNGVQLPGKAFQILLAKHFGCTVEELFPPKANDNGKSAT